MKNALAVVSGMIFCLLLPPTAPAVAQRGTLAGVAGLPRSDTGWARPIPNKR
jgi:hypothetical protein